MSRTIKDSITALETSLDSCKTSLEGKSVTVETRPKVSELPALIDSIQAGVSDSGIPKYFSVTPNEFNTEEGCNGTYHITVSEEQKAAYEKKYGDSYYTSFEIDCWSGVAVDNNEFSYSMGEGKGYDITISGASGREDFVIMLLFNDNNGRDQCIDAFSPTKYNPNY